jgi:hypothetical protein
MLYPIELLRHKSPRKECGAMDGVHVNGQARFCHVVRRLFKCRQTPHGSVALFTVQIASPQNAIIAKCNAGILQKYLNSLFLKDLITVRLLACGLL